MTKPDLIVGGVPLWQGEDNLYRDRQGTVFGIADKNLSVDDETRLGVGPFSLPKSDPLTDAAKAHDYMYSCPAWQETHTREESDKILYEQLKQLAGKNTLSQLEAELLYSITRMFGNLFWEGKK